MMTVTFPTFAELADPKRIDPAIRDALHAVDPDAPDPRNLFRVHWYNGADRRPGRRRPRTRRAAGSPHRRPRPHRRRARQPVPDDPRAQGARGLRLPRAEAGERLVRPGAHKAIWPSTGNYCRGGVAISRIMGCRGVAVLPEG
jgi:cysteine synthase